MGAMRREPGCAALRPAPREKARPAGVLFDDAPRLGSTGLVSLSPASGCTWGTPRHTWRSSGRALEAPKRSGPGPGHAGLSIEPLPWSSSLARLRAARPLGWSGGAIGEALGAPGAGPAGVVGGAVRRAAAAAGCEADVQLSMPATACAGLTSALIYQQLTSTPVQGRRQGEGLIGENSRE